MSDALEVKNIEKVTNHDVKVVGIPLETEMPITFRNFPAPAVISFGFYYFEQTMMETALRKCKKQSEPERIMRRKKKASLIIQKPAGEREHVYGTRLVDINEGKFNLRMKEEYLEIPCRGRIRSWCNELLLITDPFKLGALYIFNLVTKEGSTLPPSSSPCSGHVGCKCGLGLAYDKFKGAYKGKGTIFGMTPSLLKGVSTFGGGENCWSGSTCNLILLFLELFSAVHLNSYGGYQIHAFKAYPGRMELCLLPQVSNGVA
ncbi:hypothetical protein F0562_026330 [Nyssa sinensis]|uniref:Uncharacterized protein n=1 Tax=Nyssa sinensis TaxID=561372 RepID=A0A5J5BAL1_9ASTE|nr:hypothetical protein F0562_026330 [Nyssa sinensis]